MVRKSGVSKKCKKEGGEFSAGGICRVEDELTHRKAKVPKILICKSIGIESGKI